MSRPVLRRLGVLCAVVAMPLSLAGCGSSAKSLARNEIVVVFSPTHSTADVQQAREACNGVGGAKAEASGPDTAMNRSRPLRFDVTGLDMQQQAKLSACLSKQPAVQGFEDNDDAGG